MWATEWLTPTSGISRYEAKARATVAPVRSEGPSPGPCEKAMQVNSLALMPAFVRASWRTISATSAWCLAASLWMYAAFGWDVAVRFIRQNFPVKRCYANAEVVS